MINHAGGYQQGTKRTNAAGATPLGMTTTNRTKGLGRAMDTPQPSPDNYPDYPAPSQPYVSDYPTTERKPELNSPKLESKPSGIEEFAATPNVVDKSPNNESLRDIDRTAFNSSESPTNTKKIDPRVYIVVNQKPAMKKRLITDLDLVIYIDCARFLPDNINLSKIKVSFYNRDGKVIGNESEHAKMLTADSDIYSPTYNMKIQLNKDDYDMAEGIWMICSLYTLEVSVQEDMNTSVFFGYTIFPLAVTEKEGKDPFIFGFNRLVLNHGAFQLPIYSPRQSRDTLEETILAIEYPQLMKV